MKHIQKYFLIFIFSIGINAPSVAQSVSLSGDIYEYATYYVSSFDLNTGATNVQIFRYELSASEYPTTLKVWFRSSVVSPSLGLENQTTILEIETDVFDLQAPLILDNRDLSSQTSVIYDLASPPNSIELTGQILDRLDPNQAESILQSILTTGRIADGEYTFEIQIRTDDDQVLASDDKTIIVQSPVSINLESPGGALSDTLNNTIYTSFPIFQWYAQTCNGCESFIRVAEFKSGVHNSLEDALDDQRVLPFNQNDEWFQISTTTSFQYPFSDAYPLEEGNVYGWQVKLTLPTTSGSEEMVSTPYAFKIGVTGTVEQINSVTNPLLMALQQALGDDQFNALFGQGNDLQGFTPTGQLKINGINVDAAGVNYLLNQIGNENYSIQNVRVE